MSDDPGTLMSMGIKFQDLLAGIGGGIVNALALKRSDPGSIISSIVVGGITANYLSEFLQHYLGTSPSTSGFLVGLGGMAFCQSIIAGLSKFNVLGQTKVNQDANPNP